MSTRVKAEALADYLEREGKTPASKFVTDAGFKLGQFWGSLVSKRKRNEAVVEAVLAERPEAKAVYDRELRNMRPTNVRDKAEALAKHLEREGKAHRPPASSSSHRGSAQANQGRGRGRAGELRAQGGLRREWPEAQKCDSKYRCVHCRSKGQKFDRRRLQARQFWGSGQCTDQRAHMPFGIKNEEVVQGRAAPKRVGLSQIPDDAKLGGCSLRAQQGRGRGRAGGCGPCAKCAPNSGRKATDGARAARARACKRECVCVCV